MFRLSRSATRLVSKAGGGCAHRRFADLSKHGNVLGGENIDPRALETFEAWHSAVDAAMKGSHPSEEVKTQLRNRVDENCKFYPPTYHSNWEGRDEFLLIIECVSEVFGKSFTYGRQWLSPDGRDWVLEFNTDIGDTKRRMTGVDMVKLNEEVCDVTLMSKESSTSHSFSL